MSFHTNENTCKRSARGLGEKEATKIIRRANRKYARKLRKLVREEKREEKDVYLVVKKGVRRERGEREREFASF
jgi:hypothetical protein